MSRPLSAASKASVFSLSTNVVWLYLLTLDHADMVSPIRVVNNYESVTSNGDLYQPFPFDISVPQELEDQMPDVTLTIDNVDRSIVSAVRALPTPPTVTLSVINSADVDLVESGPYNFTLQDVTYDRLVVSGRLGFEPMLDLKYPTAAFVPATFPGLF